MSGTTTTQQDALAKSLQAALVPPKPGMKRIPFPLDTYEHPSKPLSDKRLVNYFAEASPADARTAGALVPTAGLLVAFTVGDGPVFAFNSDSAEAAYVVSGTHFYRLTGSPGSVVVEDLGAVGLAADPYFTTIAGGVNSVVVVVPPNAYTCGHAFGDPLNQITGGDWPSAGAASVCYVDGYFIFNEYGASPRFFISQILDPMAYSALDFAFADAVPNNLVRVVSHRGQLWLIGTKSIEVWYDSGNADFPFRRVPGGLIQGGCANGQSVAQIDNSIWWCGNDATIYRTAGYEARRVSNHALERFIRSQGPDQVTRAIGHSEVGHAIYVCTINDRTFCYDANTQAWHERTSGADGDGPWRPTCSGHWVGVYLMGDGDSGKIFQPTPHVYADDGVTVRRQINFPPIFAGTNRAFCHRLEIEMDVGTAASAGEEVELVWSDDGGINFTAPRILATGALGETRTRVVTTRLGSFRQREFSLVTWGSPVIFAVDCDIQQGIS